MWNIFKKRKKEEYPELDEEILEVKEEPVIKRDEELAKKLESKREYTCSKCGHNYKYDHVKQHPRLCPWCGKRINRDF